MITTDACLPPTQAARCGDVACIRLLLEAGADVRAIAGPTGKSALHIAAEHGHAEAAAALIAAGASTTAKAKDGRTAAECAATSDAAMRRVCRLATFVGARGGGSSRAGGRRERQRARRRGRRGRRGRRRERQPRRRRQRPLRQRPGGGGDRGGVRRMRERWRL